MYACNPSTLSFCGVLVQPKNWLVQVVDLVFEVREIYLPNPRLIESQKKGGNFRITASTTTTLSPARNITADAILNYTTNV